MSIALSLCSIGYCLMIIVLLFDTFAEPGESQITCYKVCGQSFSDLQSSLEVGTLFFELVPTYLVLVVLVLAEMRDIASIICSNWTKVAIIYHQVNQSCCQKSAIVKKCISLLLKHRMRCKLLNNWNGKMKQCSILKVHRSSSSCWKIPFIRCHLRDQMKKKIEVPSAVKAIIFEAIKAACEQEEAATLMNIRPPSSIGLWLDCDGKCPAYTILVWHIATSIFEVSQSHQMDEPQDSKIAATHLSRYCAYLVSTCPELLPDDDEWCKSLYEDVNKDADRILSAAPPVVAAVEYHQQLLQLLSKDSSHQVLKDGAELGKQMVDSKTGWEALARFWSEMILYVVPSENLEGHADAIARGGELITLLWALLAHAGIAGRLHAGSGNDQFEDFSEEPTVGEGFEQQPSWEEDWENFEDFTTDFEEF